MGMGYIERLAPPHSFPAEFIVQHGQVTIDTILSNREVMRIETERKHSCLHRSPLQPEKHRNHGGKGDRWRTG